MASPRKSRLDLTLEEIQSSRRGLVRLQFATSNFIATKRRSLDKLERALKAPK